MTTGRCWQTSHRDPFMKKLIVSILLACLNILHADIVAFKWSPNTEADLAGYVLRTGPAMGMPTQTHTYDTTQTRAVVAMPPHYQAWLAAVNTAGLESDPAGPLEYKPVIVLLTVESTRQAHPWVIYEIFRIDESIFDPASANIQTKLSITKGTLKVEFLNTTFPKANFFITPTFPDEFFRCYVAPNPI